MMKKLFLLAPLFALLAACKPPMTREQELAIYRSRCLEYGFRYGTPEFAQCMQQLEANEELLYMQQRQIQAIENQNWTEQQRFWNEQERVRIKNKEVRVKRQKVHEMQEQNWMEKKKAKLKKEELELQQKKYKQDKKRFRQQQQGQNQFGQQMPPQVHVAQPAQVPQLLQLQN